MFSIVQKRGCCIPHILYGCSDPGGRGARKGDVIRVERMQYLYM